MIYSDDEFYPTSSNMTKIVHYALECGVEVVVETGGKVASTHEHVQYHFIDEAFIWSRESYQTGGQGLHLIGSKGPT